VLTTQHPGSWRTDGCPRALSPQWEQWDFSADGLYQFALFPLLQVRPTGNHAAALSGTLCPSVLQGSSPVRAADLVHVLHRYASQHGCRSSLSWLMVMLFEPKLHFGTVEMPLLIGH